jgi:hypothetical protein
MRPDIKTFIDKLTGQPGRAVEITTQEIDALSKRLGPSSLRTYISMRRSAVLERFGAAHPAYDMLRLSDDQYNALRTGYQAAVSSRQTTPVRLKAIPMIAKAAALLASANPLDIVIGLCLVTGRRPVEIAAGTETRFTPIERATAAGRVRETYMLAFRGQAKTKGAPTSMHNKINPIPVLDRASIVLAAFERLRRLQPDWVGMDDARYKSFLVTLNRRAKAQLGPFWPGANAQAFTQAGYRSKTVDGALPQQAHTGRGKVKTDTHTLSVRDLRAIYAEACSRLFNKTGTADEMMKPSEYMARILGHSDHDLTTSQSYGVFVLTDFAHNPRDTGRALMTAIANARAAQPADDPVDDDQAKTGDDAPHQGNQGAPDAETKPPAPARRPRQAKAAPAPEPASPAAPPAPARRRKAAASPETPPTPAPAPSTPPAPARTRRTRAPA